jgi:hypothetical protein
VLDFKATRAAKDWHIDCCVDLRVETATVLLFNVTARCALLLYAGAVQCVCTT